MDAERRFTVPPMAGDYCYFSQALDARSRAKLVQLAVDKIRNAQLAQVVPDFDAIAIRGMSGAVFGAPLAHVLGVNLVVVRKKEDGHAHSINDIEGLRSVSKYLIVDDFIASGSTVQAIHNGITAACEYMRQECKCVGIFTYKAGGEFETLTYLNGVVKLDGSLRDYQTKLYQDYLCGPQNKGGWDD